jgi:hypothetical protein
LLSIAKFLFRYGLYFWRATKKRIKIFKNQPVLFYLGFTPFTVTKTVDQTLETFLKLYDDDFGSFESIQELFEKLQLINETQGILVHVYHI